MSMTRRQILTGTVVAGTALTIPGMLTGCGSSRKPAGLVKVADEPGFTAVREATGLVGKSLGYFADNGIDLTVNMTNPADSVKDLVAGLVSVIGDADATSILQQLSPPPGLKKAPVKGLVILGAMQKQCMFGVIFHRSRDWTGLSDLAGKTIGCATGSAGYRLWPEVANRADIDPKSVHWKFGSSTQVPLMLASGQVDAVVTYLTDLSTYNRPGDPAVAIAYDTFVLDVPGTLWIGNADWCKRNPEVARTTVAQLFRSVQYCGNHPADAGQRVAAAHPDFEAKAGEAVFAAMKNYTPDDPFITREAMARCVAALQGAGIISHIDPDSIVDRTVMPTPSKAAS
jgi:ABC-type nitrate/sulfonate/bicarbonate transport system substrate-binding protein